MNYPTHGQDYDNTFADLEMLFQKKRQIKFRQDEFSLPGSATWFRENNWEIPELNILKKRLNETKALLNEMEIVSWHKHTRAMNNAALVVPTLRTHFNPEFCTFAWSKFMECLYSYPVIPAIVVDLYRQGILTELNSVHLCEVPGAFISASNHFIVQNMPYLKWNWLATSLCPYFEGNDVAQMINEDKLILHSWKNWTFLKDGTGNLIPGDNDNIRHLSDFEIKEKGMQHVHFITADGSIDCQGNPAEQEALVARLHMAEIVTSLLILAEGGSFVLKIFTFMECETICQLYLLACTFREVHLFKPATSKEGNSEVYVISLGYLGRSKFKVQLDLLLDSLGEFEKTESKALFGIANIPRTFLIRLQDAALFFAETQMSVIERNVAALPAGPKLYNKLRRRQLVVMEMYLEKFPLIRLEKQHTLFKGINYEGGLTSLHMDPIEQTKYTIQERMSSAIEVFQKQLDWIGRNVGNYLQPHFNISGLKEEIEYYDGPVRFQFGRSYKNIRSSRFCYSRLLSLREELRLLLRSRDDKLILPVNQHRCDHGSKRINTLLRLEEFQSEARIICFHETPNDFLLRNDVDMTRDNLQAFLGFLQTLTLGESAFLCQYPLLTRLHVGLIFLLTRAFSKIFIVIDKAQKMHGIHLFNFQGFSSSGPHALRSHLGRLDTLLKGVEANSERTILEVVPMQRLCAARQWHPISSYNIFSIVQSIQSLITKEGSSSYLVPPLTKLTKKSMTRNKTVRTKRRTNDY